MSIIRALLVILGCLTLGEMTVWVLGLKPLGSIVGMGLLFATPQANWVKSSWTEEPTDILVTNLTLFLMPPCVAVISYLDVIANDQSPILTATVVSMVCVLLVTGKVHGWVRRLI